MNEELLARPIQEYINTNLNVDVNKIALAKSIFEGISAAELAGQIAAKKKSIHKLPTWFNQEGLITLHFYR